MGYATFRHGAKAQNVVVTRTAKVKNSMVLIHSLLKHFLDMNTLYSLNSQITIISF
jgi:hypothetical protein